MPGVNLHDFIAEYTDAVYHRRDPEAAGRFIADPCIRHEHGHHVVMPLAENKARIGGFIAIVKDLRFENAAVVAEGEYYAAAYQFSFEGEGTVETLSGIEIFHVQDGKITETWNSAVGAGAWG